VFRPVSTHRVDDGQRGRRERCPGDERGLCRPVQQAVGGEPGKHEGPGERDQPDRHRRDPALAEVVGVDLGAGQERQHDRGERRDEHQPRRIGVQSEEVAEHDAEPELEQRHRDADLDREHAGQHDHGGEHARKLNGIHAAASDPAGRGDENNQELHGNLRAFPSF